MLRQTSGSISPVKSSRITKSVPSAAESRVKVRTPRKRPAGRPPDQTIRRGASISTTRVLKPRSGMASDQRVKVAPGSIRPSMRAMPVPAVTSRSASARIAQTALGSAAILRVTS